MQCLQNKSEDTCNCANPLYLSLFNNSRLCLTKEELNCTNIIFNVNYVSEYIEKSCKYPVCPLECNTTEYKFTTTSIDLSGDVYLDVINERPNLLADFSSMSKSRTNLEKARKSFVYLYLSYDSLSYISSQERPNMEIVSLLANVGGNLGLFLGVSVLSLCELIDFFIEVIFLAKIRHKEKDRVEISKSKANK